uniref:NAV2 n=1 Tax=Anisakis simplex TaxID=6269 RepID=A0A0M3JF52_ANISI
LGSPLPTSPSHFGVYTSAGVHQKGISIDSRRKHSSDLDETPKSGSVFSDLGLKGKLSRSYNDEESVSYNSGSSYTSGADGTVSQQMIASGSMKPAKSSPVGGNGTGADLMGEGVQRERSATDFSDLSPSGS